MNKEQIKAAIAANLAGQGSMIDISGQLPAILDAIVDAIPEGGGGNEPLVVLGQADSAEGTFTANAGQPSWDDAKAAFESGTPVFLKFSESTDEATAQVISCSFDEAGYKVLLAYAVSSSGEFILKWII